jgi:hypothetical protein
MAKVLRSPAQEFLYRRNQFSCGQFPKFDGVFVAGRSNVFLVGAKFDHFNPIVMSWKATNQQACGGVPNFWDRV